ncbi:NUDIX hydrolase [Acrocarpospora catenulata]|uniref:NUDIX hydrolase n=1 Tax=Acrocarpospora catenulata TaxID=2836182 RepID=UPI001BDA8941|nr:NUDIX hydrolase [Acrocarpospora catenulata]
MDIPLPEELARRARDLRAGLVRPVPARDAATVVLLRDDPLRVYLLRRRTSMAFAAGAWVFPGGSVDASEQADSWAGPSPAEWAVMLGADERTARGLVCAAVRETFEESGVLLAGPTPGTVVADTTGWEAEREAVIARTLPFGEFLNGEGLVVRSDLLKPWAHWITPELEPRRFDTRFFVAALPPEQETRDVGGEADAVAWMRPAEALDAANSGKIFLMPPTIHTLTEMAAFDTIAGVFANDQKIVTFMPQVVEVHGEMRLDVSRTDYRRPR